MRLWFRNARKPASPELDRELRFHVDEMIAEKIANGIEPRQAQREAALEFGATEQLKEELRDVYRIPLLDAAATHLRYGIQALKAKPAFALTVIATLALGIGANTAVFTAIDAVLLRPLPFPDSGRLVVLHEFRVKEKKPDSAVAPVRVEDWNRLNHTFEPVSGYYTEDTTATNGGFYTEGKTAATSSLPVKITRAFVAPRFFQVMGVAPALGHDFTSADAHFEGYAPQSVILSDRYWREHFHADPRALGQPLLPGKSSAIVIGVMPPGFAFPSEEVQLWYIIPPDAPYAVDRTHTWYTGLGRLKAGVSESQARADLALVQNQLAAQFPSTDRNLAAQVVALKETTVGSSRASLWLLFAAVSVLLLIACTNVSALLLARGMERKREFSVRLSLGASRFNILAQVLFETLLLAVAGTVAGLALALASSKILTAMAKSIPRIGEVGLDWRLFAYTAVCSVLVTLLSGLFPALQASSAAPAEALCRGGRSQVSTSRPLQWVLVSVQVALAICLLSGAGLLLRSFQVLSQVSAGFDASNVLVFRLTGTYAETADIPKLRQSVLTTLDALRSIPGVQSAASTLFLPGVPFKFPIALTSPEATLDPTRKVTVEGRYVSAGYFAALRIPLLAGRVCDQYSDGSGIVVNRSFANSYFGTTANPIGHHFQPTNHVLGDKPSAILGIVADARESGLDQPPGPTVYWCAPPLDPGRYYLLRTSVDAASLANAVREKLHAVQSARAVYDLAPLPTFLSDAFSEVRLRTLLLTLFAATALLLASVGLYGTMSYFVNTRRREVGLRMALGAERRQISRRFIGQGLRVTAAGILGGLCLAIWSARFIGALLYNVGAHDLIALASSVATMLFVALIACAVPAFRAARLDPIQTLREE